MARKKVRGRSFESMGEKFTAPDGKRKKESFANIYESMLLSDAFQSLTERQRLLYVVCKAQYYGKRKPGYEYKDAGLFQGDEYFFLNWAAVQKYGIYTANSHSNFYRDMQALEAHGLIKLEASGQKRKTKNVYSYSDKWQAWQPP